MIITSKQRNQWRSRYFRIQGNLEKYSKQMSLHLADVRAAFPLGNSGDSQFKEWCVDDLDVSVRRACGLLRQSLAPTSLEGFDDYADSQAASTAMNYPKGELRKIKAEIKRTRKGTRFEGNLISRGVITQV